MGEACPLQFKYCLRPILGSTGSFNHDCAKWLSDILNILLSHSTNFNGMLSLIAEVKNLSLSVSVMYSFDVVSLFTNLPLQFTTQLILDAIFKDDVEIFRKLNKRRNRTTQLGSIEHNSTVLREILQASGWGGNGQVDRESVVELMDEK